MSFKKYVISMIICAVTIFVMICSAFVPIKSYASITIEQEFSTYYYAAGIQQGIPYLYSYFQNLVGYNSNVKDKYNEFCTYNYSKVLYMTTVNKELGTKNFRVVKYNSLNTSKSSYLRLMFTGCEAVSLTISTSLTSDGVEVVGASINKSLTDRDYYSFSDIRLDLNDYYLQFSNSVSSEFDNTTENDLGLQTNKFLAFGDWLLNTIGNTGALAYTGDYGSFFDNLQDINRTYLKNFLGTTDDGLIDDVYKAFLNGNWGDVLLGNNEPLQAEQIADISNILKNLQNVYEQSISINYNEGDSKYYITPRTEYNSYTKKQVTDYYNRYVAYNTTNNYSNVTYNVDLTTTNSFISSVNANIIALNNNIIVLSNTINDFFINFDIRIKNILVDLGLNNIVTILDLINSNVKNISTGSSSDVDLTSVTTILTSIDTRIESSFNSLGGIISGAIGVAWADIKADLQLIIDGINFNFKLGDIIVGDSTSSNDDTSNDIKVKGLDHVFDDLKNSFDNSIGDLNLNFKRLFDDLNLNLDDFFKDIHVTIDKDDSNSDTPATDDSFLIQVKNILVRKIPLYRQCLNFLEPVTNISYNSVADTNRVLLTDTSSTNSSISTTSIEDGQLDLNTKYDTNIFDGLAVITTDVSGNVVSFSVVFDTVNFMGVELNKFTFNLSPYKEKYKTIVSDILLTSVYILFAWNIIRRIPTIFGHSKEE